MPNQKCKVCERCDYNKAVGKVQEYNGKILNVCVRCAWDMYDEVDGNVEIVDDI